MAHECIEKRPPVKHSFSFLQENTEFYSSIQHPVWNSGKYTVKRTLLHTYNKTYAIISIKYINILYYIL